MLVNLKTITMLVQGQREDANGSVASAARGRRVLGGWRWQQQSGGTLEGREYEQGTKFSEVSILRGLADAQNSTGSLRR